MRRIISLVSAAALTAVATLAASAGPAQAVSGPYVYDGAAGGTQIYALGTAISSGLTASSNLSGDEYPASRVVSVAGVSVPHLATVGAVTTGQAAFEIPGGYQISSSAETATVKLLDGLITADALQITANARNVNGVFGSGTTSKFVHLKVGSIFVPANVAPNTTLNLAGIAKVVLNESVPYPAPFGIGAAVRGASIHVTLLKPMNGAPAGAEIFVNPVRALMVPKISSDYQVIGGRTDALFAGIGVGSSARVLIEPAGELNLPSYGTNNETFTNNIAGINIKNVATIGAVKTSMRGLSLPNFGFATTQAELAKVNLLNGLITADAIQSTATTFGNDNFVVKDPSFKFVNLTIAGKPIAINVKPNTLINVLGVAKIYLNQQINTAHSTTVYGLRIILSTAKFGLPIGAEIHVAAANSFIGTIP